MYEFSRFPSWKIGSLLLHGDAMKDEMNNKRTIYGKLVHDTVVERSSSVVECRTRNRESPGSNPPLLPFRRLGIFRSLHRRPCSLSCINEYLAIDSGGNVSDLVLARNCCLARMLPGEAENGVGMNRSVREGKKCEAL